MDKFEIVIFTTEALKRVLEMRQAGGLSVFSGLDVDHNLHQRLIADEKKELEDATTLADRADNHADVLVFQLGYVIDIAGSEAHLFSDSGLLWEACHCIEWCIAKCNEDGINHREAFRLVHESNLSKLVKADEIEDTSLKYGKCNVVFKEVSNDLFSCFAARTFHYNGELIPKGKWLKSTGFFAPRWEEDKSWIL